MPYASTRTTTCLWEPPLPRAESLGSYLDALASAAPTPGGGAAAAWTLAQAAALLAMVCRLTQGKSDSAPQEDALKMVLADALAVQNAAERLADLDSLAFLGYGAALKLPKEGPGAAEARTLALLTALEEAASVPLALHGLASHVLEPGASLRFLRHAGNPRVLSDVSVARCLALAALEASKENVNVNLDLFKKLASSPAVKGQATQPHSENIYHEVIQRMDYLSQSLAASEARALAPQDPTESAVGPPTDGPKRISEILQALPLRLR